MNIRAEVESAYREACENRNVKAPESMSEEMVLLESGLDSLGFAVLVTDLEFKLGYDPFTLMDEPVYPRTFGELLAIYERFKEHAQ